MGLDPTRRGHAFDGPRFEVPAERPVAVRGLSERQARLASDAFDRPRWLLPNYGLIPQVADQLKKRPPFECPICEEKARELEGTGELRG